jgi:hypothetical protein
LPTGLAIAVSLERPLAAVNAKLGVVRQLPCTISAIHKEASHEGCTFVSAPIIAGNWKIEIGKMESRNLETGN